MSDDVTQLTGQDDLQPGNLFAGKYRVEKLLGKGGFGAVYLVKNEIGWDLALKLLHPEHGADAGYRARFLREMGLARDLLHPNAVPVRDAGVERGRLYYTMDFVPGKSLKDLIQQEGAIAPARAAEWMKQVLSFLSFLHGKGYVHRDLKPDNLIVQVENGAERVRVLDLGIAKSIAATTDTMQLTGGAVIGTPHYMAPEHTAGEEIDHRIDLYAVGVILYECCGGRRPFHGATHLKLFHAIRTEDARPLTQVVPGFPDALWQVIATALQKDRELRYRDAAAFAAALDQILPQLKTADQTVVQARGGGGTVAVHRVERTQQQSGGGGTAARPKSRAVLWLALAVLLAAGAGGAWYLWGRGGDAGDAPFQIEQVEPTRGSSLKADDTLLVVTANRPLRRASIDGLTAAVEGRKARATLHRGARVGTTAIPVRLWDEQERELTDAIQFDLQPAGQGPSPDRTPPELVARTPDATAEQSAPFVLEVEASKELQAAQIDGRAADTVAGRRASAQIGSLKDKPAGDYTVLVTLTDKAGNQSPELKLPVRWKPTRQIPVEPTNRKTTGKLEALDAGAVGADGFWTLARDPDSGVVFVLVPASGAQGFWRGDDSERSLVKPRHKVAIGAPFYLSQSLITRQQYAAVTGKDAPDVHAANDRITSVPEHPVTGLTWAEAKAFCDKLGGRLPTEAEWEWTRYQAMGLDPARESVPLFPWRGKEAVAGKDWVNTDDTKDPDPFVSLAPATAFPRETVRSQLKLPLFDLLGNAMEFCRDPFLEYSKLTALKPMADSKDYSQAIADPGRPGVTPEGDLKDHVVRGSSWAEPRDYCTLQRRRRERELEGRLEEVGFRVCIPAK